MTQLLEDLAEIKKLSKDLNDVTNGVTECIVALDKYLAGCHLGITVDDFQCRYGKIVYARHHGNFHLMLKPPDDAESVPLASASREVKLDVISKLPEFIHALRSKVTNMLSQARKAEVKADEMLDEIVGMFSALPPEV